MNLLEQLGQDSALFLDFDGTLVDIAPTPDAVVVPPGLIDALGELHERLGGALAVISGRPIEQIDAFLHPLRLPAAGVHGVERRRSDGGVEVVDAAVPDRVRQAAEELAARHAGLQLEIKRGSIALHYRGAPELEALCVAAMQAAVDASPGLILLRGKMVAEAKPADASKGRAIEAFLGEAPFRDRRPVFIGDDVTDEVGFSAVQRSGGLGIKVGEGASVARHRLPSAAAVREQLVRMARTTRTSLT
ncbi:trehalose-phosphatase [Ramlibacter sp. AW1]|uniref:Trehalose 6-phosphate phosphatase n=1 Tax=Ramlibacter aurantiacus TaxID=2801330 RepID=A0A936ZPI8_9BURK|nr:trehalose-phosphatase [Ramlibacter aurantiacus]MBL0421150.1 trehalose-phosphatase [Ramlibacter aurantiacus]